MRPIYRTRPRSLRRDLRIILAEGVSFSVMVGVGESYLAAFVLALGMGEVAAGLVTTVPLLVGGVIQLITPVGVRWMGSRRRWSAVCAVIQAASFVPVIGVAWAGRGPVLLVFVSASVYWAAGMAIGPAWNAWVDWLVPRPVRAGFFARRTAAVQLGLLLSLLLGGLILQGAVGIGYPIGGFVLVFAIALLARAVSARLLALQSEEEGHLASGEDDFRLFRWPGNVFSGRESRFLLYLLVLTGSVTIASPYFSPYMLSELGFTYTQYTILIGASLIAKVAALPLMSAMASRFGLVSLLRLAWLGIAPLPALWLVSGDFYYLLALQIVSGAFWAVQEYVAFLLLFETIPMSRRIGVLTAYNLANALFMVGGSIVGGWLFTLVGGGERGYLSIFGLSSVTRIGCLWLLARIRTGRVATRALAFRPIAIRPSTGAVLRPILAPFERRGRGLPGPRREGPNGRPVGGDAGDKTDPGSESREGA